MSAPGLPSGDPTNGPVAGAEIAVSESAPVPEGGGAPETAGSESGRKTWQAIEVLAAILEPEAFDPDVDAAPDWRERTKDTALAYAAKVITSGYRRAVEDDDTLTRVMWACAAVDDYLPGEMSSAGIEYYARLARAAVRALRDGSGQ